MAPTCVVKTSYTSEDRNRDRGPPPTLWPERGKLPLDEVNASCQPLITVEFRSDTRCTV